MQGQAMALGPIRTTTVSALGHRSFAGALTIRRHNVWRAVALQCIPHEMQSGGFVSALGNKAFNNFTLPIDGTPDVRHLAIYADVHLVEVPVPMTKTPHSAIR